MWKAIVFPFKWFFSAFNVKEDGGLSMRKAIVIWCMILVQRMNNKYLDAQKDILGNRDVISIGDFSLIPTLTLYAYIMIGICLGMIMIPQILSGLSIILNRNNKVDEKESSSPSVS